MNEKIRKTEFGFYTMVDDTHLSRWVEQDGNLEHARGYIDRFKESIPVGGTVLDCGTSIGDHTLTYAKLVGPTGTVIGFEANPDVYECCAMNMAEYPWVRIYNIGLSGVYGVAGINIDPNVGASHLTNTGREIMLAPLDRLTYIQALTRLDFIKVDIEGCEGKFLAGAVETLNKFHPVIVMEINEEALKRQGATPDLVFNQLIGLRYQYWPVEGRFGWPQYDIVCHYNPFGGKRKTPYDSIMRKKA